MCFEGQAGCKVSSLYCTVGLQDSSVPVCARPLWSKRFLIHYTWIKLSHKTQKRWEVRLLHEAGCSHGAFHFTLVLVKGPYFYASSVLY